MKLFLLKAIVRMLADAGTAEAGELFWEEWARRKTGPMHEDLVKEIVKLAVQALVSEKPIKAVAWKIAEEAVADRSLKPETSGLVLLLEWQPQQAHGMPCFANAGSVHGDHPRAREFQRVFAAISAESNASFIFGNNRPDPDLLSRLQKLMCTLQTTHTGTSDTTAVCEPIRIMAECRVYSFSRAVIGEADPEALEALQKAMLRPLTDIQEPERYYLQHMALMYASLAKRVLDAAWREYPDVQRVQGVAMAELTKSHPAATHLTASTDRILETLIQTAPAKVALREQLGILAKEIAGVFKGSSGKPQWYKSLIGEPLKAKLELLRLDREHTAGCTE